MRIALVTNMVSHHQMPFAEKVAQEIGAENFRYIAMGDVSAERKNMGWSDNSANSWVMRLSDSNYLECYDWMCGADILVSGELLFDIFKKRLKNNLLTIYMSERWWKPSIGVFRLLSLRFLIKTINYRNLTKSKKFVYLAISDYAAKDISLISCKGRRIWRWGYFTDNKKVPRLVDGLTINVLWAGRFLFWKRVDILVEAVAKVCQVGIPIRLNLIGDGVHKSKIQKLANKILPNGVCSFLPSMPADKVYEEMGRSDIFVLPSNGYEGWGAVVNEAMAAGCVVIASDAVGSSVSIIRDGVNGFLFKSGDVVDLCKKLIMVSGDPVLRHKVSAASIESIDEKWSPHVAATRFVSVCRSELSGERINFYYDGPLEIL